MPDLPATTQQDAPIMGATVPIRDPGLPDPTPMAILAQAVQQGVPIEALERLQAMAERAEDRRAAAEFASALAAFQAELPAVPKNRTAKVATKSGGTYSYAYANLDDILKIVRPIMARHGLSVSFDTHQAEGGIVESCTVRHAGGHSVTASSPVVSMTPGTPGMSSQQGAGNAQTYARRYALTGALGISTGDEDNDGAAPDEPISEQEVAKVLQALSDLGGDKARFCRAFHVEKVSDLRQSQMKRVWSELERKRREVEGA